MSKPTITKTNHLLPFDQLSPLQFERLCLWLVERKGYLYPQHLGEAGSEQGRDVSAYQPTDVGEQLWYFQCKRYRSLSAATLIKEVEKYNELAASDPTKRPFGIVFVTNATLSADAREKVESFCRTQGYACEFWAGTELDLFVKKHRDIVTEFFNFAPPPTISALHQIPDPPRDFTGRDEELQDLFANLNNGVTIFGIHGMGGVGKTALACRLVAEIEERFDAHLYIDLRGTHPQPLTHVEAMTYVVQAFDRNFKPPEDEARVAGIYQSMLRQQRVLLLFDDALDRQQVERLVPPVGCMLVVTSRQHFRLSGMYNCDLNILPDEDAHQMLLRLAPRIGEQAEELARLCGNLPIALQLAASALIEHCRNLTPAEYAQRLRKRREQRLKLVEATFETSYELLDELLRKLWRELSIWQPNAFVLWLGTPYLDATAAAAIWGMRDYNSCSFFRKLFAPEHSLPLKIEEAQEVLGKLVRYSLVEWDAKTNQYRLHELARTFADSKLPGEERLVAKRRYQKHLSKMQAESLARLETLIQNALLSRLRLRAYELMTSGNNLLEKGEARNGIRLLKEALAIYRNIQDREGEGMVLGDLGNAYILLGKADKAFRFLQRARVISREMGNHKREGLCLASIGAACATSGAPRNAVKFMEQALAIFREIDECHSEGQTLWGLSLVLYQLGEHDRAIACAEASLQIKEETEDPQVSDVRTQLAEWRGQRLETTDDFAYADEVIYQRAPFDPNDDFRREQLNKLIVKVRMTVAVRTTNLVVLLGTYLGMLGFAKFVPDAAALTVKALFLVPLLCWMAGLYQCLKVAKTEELTIYRNSPADIRQKLGDLAKEKQRELNLAFYWMLGGLAASFLLVALRMKMTV